MHDHIFYKILVNSLDKLSFGHCPILAQMNLQHSQTQPYGRMYLHYFLYSNSLYVKHHTEYQLVLYLKSLVRLSPGQIRTQDLPISKWILYQYTMDTVDQVIRTKNAWVSEKFHSGNHSKTGGHIGCFSKTDTSTRNLNKIFNFIQILSYFLKNLFGNPSIRSTTGRIYLIFIMMTHSSVCYCFFIVCKLVARGCVIKTP